MTMTHNNFFFIKTLKTPLLLLFFFLTFNVIYVQDSPKYRLTELVRFCGLGLRALVSTEASVQRVEKERYHTGLGDNSLW